MLDRNDALLITCIHIHTSKANTKTCVLDLEESTIEKIHIQYIDYVQSILFAITQINSMQGQLRNKMEPGLLRRD